MLLSLGHKLLKVTDSYSLTSAAVPAIEDDAPRNMFDIGRCLRIEEALAGKACGPNADWPGEVPGGRVEVT